MDSPPLSSAEKKNLRGIAQRLKPHVQLGKHGLSAAVLAELETALTKNGLIKVRFECDREGIKNFCAEITAQTHSELVGSVGKVAVFFRDMPEQT
ncbi:YhbY family RNA-binding protein [bacterium]|nr:YhbY family RNA-binding protein [bacterium]